MAREVLVQEGFTGDDITIGLQVQWWESYLPETKQGGYVDAVGDYTITGVDSRGVDWGPSVGGNQTRTLRYPYQYAAYDRVRDIGVLAGRAPGTERAPDEITFEAAARAQARAMLTLVRARGWDLWTVYRTGKYLEHDGSDYQLRLGYPTANRWNLKGEPR